MIDISCLCGKAFRAPPELAGKQVKCPSCGQPFVVPSPQPEANDPFVVDLSSFEDQSAPAQAQAPAQAPHDPLGLGAGAAPQMPAQQQWGGYDQQTFAQPTATRPKRKGNGKTGFYVAVSVGAVAGVAALIGLAFLIMGLFGSPHERIIKKMFKITDRMITAIESVDDAASADRAAATLKDCVADFKKLEPKARALKDPSPAVKKRIDEYVKKKTSELQVRMAPAIQKLSQNPALAMRLTGPLMELGSAFGGMGRNPLGRMPSGRTPRIPSTPNRPGFGSMPQF